MAPPESCTTLFEPTPFPLDCIAEVIDYINDPRTLFALLTVSKSVFRLAVSKLYKDPFGLHPWSPRAINGFVRFVLTFSPVVDETIRNFRKYLSIEFPRQKPPFVDYVSLMRSFTYDQSERFDPEWTNAIPHYPDTRPGLVHAAIAHRLSEVRDITMSNDYIGFYTERLHLLTSLQQVTFLHMTNHVHLFVRGFIRRFGAKGRRLRVYTINVTEEGIDLFYETLSLLDPYDRRPRAIKDHNILSCIAQRDKLDFGHVKTMRWELRGQDWYLAAILPRCHSLEKLTLYLHDNHYRVLAWAPHAFWAAQAQDPPTAPPAPVEVLSISGEAFTAMDALDDALQGFARTLQEASISLETVDSEDFHVLRFGPDLQVPHLRHFFIFNALINVSVSFQADSIPWMPSLEILVISDGDEESEIDHNLVSPLTPWAPLHLPWLTHIRLIGRAAAEFNPISLRSMTCLYQLDLQVPYAWENLWDRDKWRWNWYMPIKSLTLCGLIATTFHFGAFTHLPELEWLTLDLWTGGSEWTVPLADHKGMLESIRENPEELQSVPALSKTLKYLKVCGKSLLVHDVLWELILGPWFPELEQLCFSGIRRRSDSLILSLCKRHPQLTMYNGRTVKKYEQ